MPAFKKDGSECPIFFCAWPYSYVDIRIMSKLKKQNKSLMTQQEKSCKEYFVRIKLFFFAVYVRDNKAHKMSAQKNPTARHFTYYYFF